MPINFSASNTLIFNTIIPSRTSKKIISFFEDFLNLPTSTPTELNAYFAELHYTSFTSYHRIQSLNYTLADYNVSFSFVRPVFFNHFFLPWHIHISIRNTDLELSDSQQKTYVTLSPTMCSLISPNVHKLCNEIYICIYITCRCVHLCVWADAITINILASVPVYWQFFPPKKLKLCRSKTTQVETRWVLLVGCLKVWVIRV